MSKIKWKPYRHFAANGVDEVLALGAHLGKALGFRQLPQWDLMNPSRKESRLALALEEPPDKRVAFVDGQCTGDPDLRQRLEALLAALIHNQRTSFRPSPC